MNDKGQYYLHSFTKSMIMKFLLMAKIIVCARTVSIILYCIPQLASNNNVSKDITILCSRVSCVKTQYNRQT